MTIETLLDKGLPKKYEKDVYETKCSAVYQHVYDAYSGEGYSVYQSVVSDDSEPLEIHPDCSICGNELQMVLRGMATYEAYHSSRYYIAGCTVDPEDSEGEWWCPICERFSNS